MDHISDILYNQENKYYLFMFSFVYVVSVAYFISLYVFDNNTKNNITETFNDEYENDSDDSSSVDSNEVDNDVDDVSNKVENVTDELEYPKLFKLFSRLTCNQLIKIIGKNNKYKSKHEMIKLAIEKFRTYTIERSLTKFVYFPKYIKMNIAYNNELYTEELSQLFNSMAKEK
jgi:hypothetical protein